MNYVPSPLFWGKCIVFIHQSTNVFTSNPSYILNVNSSKLCILSYYYISIYISLLQFDPIFVKSITPFPTHIIIINRQILTRYRALVNLQNRYYCSKCKIFFMKYFHIQTFFLWNIKKGPENSFGIRWYLY
jgi:hypothetical protein